MNVAGLRSAVVPHPPLSQMRLRRVRHETICTVVGYQGVTSVVDLWLSYGLA